MKPTVLLFDIDGTLISSSGAGRRALDRAFVELHRSSEAIAHFKLDGMTDRAIVRLGLQALGKTPDDAGIDAVLERYLVNLAVEVEKTPASDYRVHDGMVEAMAAGKQRGMAIGLGTGNVRNGARIKLTRVGLYDSFAFGGFGDDDERRPELIRRGAQRGVELLGSNWDETRVVIIGDTPMDVAAAQAIGAQSMGVATGRFTAAQLLEAGATWAHDTLAAPGALAQLLGE